jgi:hypothetical protein
MLAALGAVFHLHSQALLNAVPTEAVKTLIGGRKSEQSVRASVQGSLVLAVGEAGSEYSN